MKRVFNAIKEGTKKVVNINGHKERIRVFGEGLKGNKTHFAKPKQLKYALVFLIVVFGYASFIFSISAYAAKSDDAVTTFFAKALQLPAIFTSSGSVTIGELLYNREYVLHFYDATDQGDVDQAVLDQQIRDQLVENRLIEDAADKYKISLTKEEKDLAIEKIVGENGGTEEVERVLNELYGLTLKQFERLVATQLLREKINNDLIERITASHILIRVADDADENTINEAKAKIDGIRNEILSGVDFAESAKTNSEDVGSNETGGKLDPFSRGEMVEEFENAAFSLNPGDISEPIRTSFGWHIIKVEERTGEIADSFDGWLAGLRKNALVVNLY